MRIENAIASLLPNIEWHFTDDKLTIFTKNVKQPTKEEILAELDRLEEVEKQKKIDADIKKANAEAKLLALGLTIDDLEALGLA